MSWVLWLTPSILATWEAECEGIMVQGQPGQIVYETVSSKPEQNRLEIWTYMVEHLLCKQKALNSNPSPTKKVEVAIVLNIFFSLESPTSIFVAQFRFCPFCKDLSISGRIPIQCCQCISGNDQFGHTISWIQGIFREVFLFVKIHWNISIIKPTETCKVS
jgi:hypothetical protein